MRVLVRPARRLTRHHGREVTRAEAHERIGGIEGRHHQLADFPLRDGIAGPRADDLDDDALVDDHAVMRTSAFLCALIGDDAEIGRGVALQCAYAASPVFLAERGKQGTAGDQGDLVCRNVFSRFVGAVEYHLQEVRRACVDLRLEDDSGIDLHVGIAGAGRENETTKGARALVDDEAAWRHVIGEAVVDNVPGADACGIQRPGARKGIGAKALRLPHRAGGRERRARA
jgi:hypothetical protein